MAPEIELIPEALIVRIAERLHSWTAGARSHVLGRPDPRLRQHGRPFAARRPAKAAAAIRTALAADNTPLRLPLGSDGFDAAGQHLNAIRAKLDTWTSVARDTALD